MHNSSRLVITGLAVLIKWRPASAQGCQVCTKQAAERAARQFSIHIMWCTPQPMQPALARATSVPAITLLSQQQSLNTTNLCASCLSSVHVCTGSLHSTSPCCSAVFSQAAGTESTTSLKEDTHSTRQQGCEWTTTAPRAACHALTLVCNTQHTRQDVLFNLLPYPWWPCSCKYPRC